MIKKNNPPLKGQTLKGNAKAYNETDDQFFASENSRISKGASPRWQEALSNKREYEKRGLKAKPSGTYGKVNAISMSSKNSGRKVSPSMQKAASGELKGQTLGRSQMRSEMETRKSMSRKPDVTVTVTQRKKK